MKNEFIIWGAGPEGPDKRKALAPHIMNSFFMKTKSIHCFLSVCKKLDWMLCNLFNHAKKVELVCCERCDLARKLNSLFLSFWACEKLNSFSISFFYCKELIIWVMNHSFWTKDKSKINNSFSTAIYFVNKKLNNAWLW